MLEHLYAVRRLKSEKLTTRIHRTPKLSLHTPVLLRGWCSIFVCTDFRFLFVVYQIVSPLEQTRQFGRTKSAMCIQNSYWVKSWCDVIEKCVALPFAVSFSQSTIECVGSSRILFKFTPCWRWLTSNAEHRMCRIYLFVWPFSARFFCLNGEHKHMNKSRDDVAVLVFCCLYCICRFSERITSLTQSPTVQISLAENYVFARLQGSNRSSSRPRICAAKGIDVNGD